MIATVTPNPAIDITLYVADRIALGSSHRANAQGRRAGGKGVNVSRVLAQAGFDSTALGMVGRDDVDWFCADIEPARFVAIACDSPTRHSYAVRETSLDRVTVYNEPGHARRSAEWAQLTTAARDAARAASTLVVAGSIPPDPPVGAVAALVEAGVEAGAVVVADLVGDALLEAIEAGATVVKPNHDELRETLGSLTPAEGARQLRERGARLVLVSLGERGMVAFDDRHPAGVAARLDAVLTGNPTGAGDAAVAAVAAATETGLDLRGDLEEILRRAVAWSASAVLAPLAGSLHPSHRDLLPRVVVTTP